jgi:hypothetical protein
MTNGGTVETSLTAFQEGDATNFKNRMIEIRSDSEKSKEFLEDIGGNSPTGIGNLAIATARHAVNIGLRNEWAQFLAFLLDSPRYRSEEQKEIINTMLSTINILNLERDKVDSELEVIDHRKSSKLEIIDRKASVKEIAERKRTNTMVGAGSGAGVGAGVGALIGTVVFPGIGSVIGGLIGGGLGTSGGALIGSHV